MMNNWFVVSALVIGLSVLTSLLCTPQYREEDRRRNYEQGFKMVSLSKPLISISWVMTALVLLVGVCCYPNPQGIKVVGLVGGVVNVICLGIGWFRSGSYFTTDARNFTYIRQGQIVWRYRWEEIAHVYRRVVSTGKSVIVVYDLVLKDGTVHKSLPSTVGNLIKGHLSVERYPINWKALAIVLGILLLIVLLCVCVNL